MIGTVSTAGDDDVIWPIFLGGSARPLGCSIAFVAAPHDQVLSEVVDSHTTPCVVSPKPSLVKAVRALDPMEAPWTREVIIQCDGWTAYLNNGVGGGDLTAVAPAVSGHRGWRCISAEHIPRYGPGHAATQLWIAGPTGQPPLYYIRTLSATATDGRWQWIDWGDVQEFESLDRYARRRVRDRLDRELLIEYLAALGIRVDDPEFFGEATVVVQQAPWKTRKESVAQFRRDSGW